MIKNTLLMLSMVISLVWVSSCNVEDVVNDAIEQCTDIETDCDEDTTYEYCFDTNGAHYTFNGTTYECDGVDCEDAIIDLLEAVEEYCDTL